MRLPNSVRLYGDTFYSTLTHQEVFTPLTSAEYSLFIEAVTESETKHKRLILENELRRIGDLIAKNGT